MQPHRLSVWTTTVGGGRRGQLGTDTDDADDDVASAAAAAADGNGIHELQRTQARTDTARHSQRGRLCGQRQSVAGDKASSVDTDADDGVTSAAATDGSGFHHELVVIRRCH